MTESRRIHLALGRRSMYTVALLPWMGNISDPFPERKGKECICQICGCIPCTVLRAVFSKDCTPVGSCNWGYYLLEFTIVHYHLLFRSQTSELNGNRLETTPPHPLGFKGGADLCCSPCAAICFWFTIPWLEWEGGVRGFSLGLHHCDSSYPIGQCGGL